MWNQLLPFYELWVINCMKNIQTCSAPRAEPLSNGANPAVLGGVGGRWAQRSEMPSASTWLRAKCELGLPELLPCCWQHVARTCTLQRPSWSLLQAPWKRGRHAGATCVLCPRESRVPVPSHQRSVSVTEGQFISSEIYFINCLLEKLLQGSQQLLRAS